MFNVGDTVWVIRREYQACIARMTVLWRKGDEVGVYHPGGTSPTTVWAEDVYERREDAIAELHRRNDEELEFAIKDAQYQHAEKKRMIDGLGFGNKTCNPLAPSCPGTFEGGVGKPSSAAEFPNKWCVRECERSDMSSPGESDLPLAVRDFSDRQFNKPQTPTPSHP